MLDIDAQIKDLENKKKSLEYEKKKELFSKWCFETESWLNNNIGNTYLTKWIRGRANIFKIVGFRKVGVLGDNNSCYYEIHTDGYIEITKLGETRYGIANNSLWICKEKKSTSDIYNAPNYSAQSLHNVVDWNFSKYFKIGNINTDSPKIYDIRPINEYLPIYKHFSMYFYEFDKKRYDEIYNEVIRHANKIKELWEQFDLEDNKQGLLKYL